MAGAGTRTGLGFSSTIVRVLVGKNSLRVPVPERTE
jgi:hypothetical protein